ncbi:efflux RND transporter periplasmic adaptor subunit [Adhaeribacter soli]|uniref:Efflux RND transporter periplasmic adaptor subunit n=1 Tax=Adhaeribacter soli TaxID=2607655 RepID=A0A5N1J2K4_9BACT|nr:efflux RND transporter periplasmic adaptor subunit [Adhaeribacter soli]KAA9338862.1 efflux RND transporter periplasmic adaptor subunit [Adhaeribacter soli]
MKNIHWFVLSLFLVFSSCNKQQKEEGHAHGEGGHTHGLEPVFYTLYSDRSELFVEFKPLVVGQVSKFATHLTGLNDFKPYTEGQVTVSFVSRGKGIRSTADSASSPGLFQLALQPKTAGTGKLIFDLKTREFTDQFVIDNIPVYADEKAALAAQPADAAGTEITYLKEQAWKNEFANQQVKKQPFAEVIKTTGQVLAAPGDVVAITAKSEGILKFGKQGMIAGEPVKAGELLFSVSGSGLTQNNLEASIQEARTNLDKARTDYQRAQELIKDNIISQRDFLSIKAAYTNAQTAYNTLTKNYGAGGLRISAPINGFLQNIQVAEGQFVSAGQPLAEIAKNRKLVLRADVSQAYFPKLASIKSARFKMQNNNKVYNTSELNGKVVTYGRSTENNITVPVSFEIEMAEGIVPGAFAEVYLQTTQTQDALVIPVSALLEDQGNFYAYVQVSGEGFQKRELKLGASNGEQVQVRSGISEGERVVTKGAYQIKLSTMSGALPAHGHEH